MYSAKKWRLFTMRIDLNFPIRAMSVNHIMQSTASGRRFVTKKGREYKESIHKILLSQGHKIHSFFSEIDDEKNQVSIRIDAYYSDFFTKDGRISSKCNDADNVGKIIQDEIFKFANKNDKCVTVNMQFKHSSHKDYFTVSLSCSELLE